MKNTKGSMAGEVSRCHWFVGIRMVMLILQLGVLRLLDVTCEC